MVFKRKTNRKKNLNLYINDLCKLTNLKNIYFKFNYNIEIIQN